MTIVRLRCNSLSDTFDHVADHKQIVFILINISSLYFEEKIKAKKKDSI